MGPRRQEAGLALEVGLSAQSDLAVELGVALTAWLGPFSSRWGVPWVASFCLEKGLTYKYAKRPILLSTNVLNFYVKGHIN